MVEYGTHTHAAVNGWDFPARFGEVMQVQLTERTLNYWRGEKDKPIELPRPWPKYQPVSDEEHAELSAQLERRSALRDR